MDYVQHTDKQLAHEASMTGGGNGPVVEIVCRLKQTTLDLNGTIVGLKETIIELDQTNQQQQRTMLLLTWVMAAFGIIQIALAAWPFIHAAQSPVLMPTFPICAG